ncbi:hypothetical protein KIW84_023268, partial [Lathyrus oleraceus]
MTSTNRFKDKLIKIFVPSIFYALPPISLIFLFFYFHSFAPFFTPFTHHSSLYVSKPKEKENPNWNTCDYSNGTWIHDNRTHLYNGTTCKIKESQNCIFNGRLNSSYLHWRWKPSDWDKGGTCSKNEPYGNEEKKLEGVDAHIRSIQIEELKNSKRKAKELGLNFEVLDITKLALLRPDGHVGAYMNPFP